MDFNVFTDNIVNVLQQRMGHEYDVKVTKVTKNNDIELTGVVLMKESDNLSPTIYLDGLFEEYQDGAYIEDLAEQIIRPVSYTI